MRLEHVVQPGRPGSFFQGHMQFSSQPMQEIEQSTGFGFDDRFHHQLACAVQNRNCNGFLVNVQPDILHIATQHAEYLLGGKVILQLDHFLPRLSVLPSEPTAKMRLSYPAAVECAWTERRTGPCREATRAPTQWSRPIDKGGCFGIPFYPSSC